jgi:hypothetical protein
MFMGLRNTITDGKKWYYLFFYEFDNTRSGNIEPDWKEIRKILARKSWSWIAYSTKHGYHLVLLSPISSIEWGILKADLDKQYHSYYNGMTIRLSRKKNENQKLIELHLGSYTIPNLYNMYCSRFGLKKLREDYRYRLVFEKYWSVY